MSPSLQRIAEMNEKMLKLEEQQKFLENVLLRLDEIEKNKKILEKYYYETWFEDREENAGAMFSILSENGLYNLFLDVESTKKAIIKKLVNEL